MGTHELRVHASGLHSVRANSILLATGVYTRMRRITRHTKQHLFTVRMPLVLMQEPVGSQKMYPVTHRRLRDAHPILPGLVLKASLWGVNPVYHTTYWPLSRSAGFATGFHKCLLAFWWLSSQSPHLSDLLRGHVSITHGHVGPLNSPDELVCWWRE